MSSPLHEIDRIFRDGIENRSEYPGKNVWDNIESKLERETATRYKRKYRSLKRKTSVLLILFLGVAAYLAVHLSRKKGSNQDSNEVGSVNMPKQSHVSSPATALLPRTEVEKISGQNTTVSENNNVVYEPQLPGTNTSSQGNEFKNIYVSISQDQNRIIRGNEINLNTQALLTEDAEKENEALPKSDNASSRIKDLQGYENEQLNPVLSFSKITNDDSWQNDIAARLKPAVVAEYAIARKINYPGSDNSRFSFSAYISSNMAWTTLKDDLDHWRYSGYNNGGSNGGNNNPPTSGGNNGGNGNGGNNGGNTTGGNNGNGGGRGDNRNEINQGESENLAYSGGLKIGYNLSKRVSLQTGLNYIVNSNNVDPKLLFAGKDRNGDVGYRLNCSSGYAFLLPEGIARPSVGDSIFVTDTRNVVSYLGIPVIIEYRILSAGKFSLSASGGAQVNLLLKGKTTSLFEKGTPNETTASSKTQGLKTAYFSALTSLTAEMRLKNNLSVTLAPAGQFGISYINKETSVKTRLNYVGLAAGLKLRF